MTIVKYIPNLARIQAKSFRDEFVPKIVQTRLEDIEPGLREIPDLGIARENGRSSVVGKRIKTSLLFSTKGIERDFSKVHKKVISENVVFLRVMVDQQKFA